MTEELLEGLLTEIPFVVVVLEEVVEVVEAVVPTLRGTLVIHDDPEFPHALTCRVWEPEGDETLALIEVACTIVVLPLSIE